MKDELTTKCPICGETLTIAKYGEIVKCPGCNMKICPYCMGSCDFDHGNGALRCSYCGKDFCRCGHVMSKAPYSRSAVFSIVYTCDKCNEKYYE